ncbi:PREDICTED: RNA polymerase II C-terminal domain phosphatase-like 3 [Tarenaya hassleriana]|uniref:RNA polymerase II C-terminal domain phosphatase-like 3 n=1 Tax=Tarenaya hassleriana TaxID=28532 RepID=UPI00053C64D9|nr:PREDICTED: RNA polymerase II C-terminal domain phosphatase-like 3 [Tarenaya hassleriana]
MFVAGSGCSRTLIGMGKDDESVVMADVEEGEISDAASVEEISEDDFVRQQGRTSSSPAAIAAAGGGGNNIGARGSNGSNPRVWTMRDLLTKYPGYRGYAASGLYNFAWAQAVQNKSLNEAMGMEIGSENEKGSSQSRIKEGDKIAIDDSEDNEREEGELEEGEIDLDSVPIDDKLGVVGIQTKPVSGAVANVVQTDTKEKDLENRVKLIRAVLESTSLVEAHAAFGGVCSKLLGALESLQELVSENDDFPKRDTLIQLSFAALETVNSVFCSMNIISKELNKETMSRLLSIVKSHFSRYLSSNQIKEVGSSGLNADGQKDENFPLHFKAREERVSISFSPGALCAGTGNKEEEGMAIDGITQKDNGVIASSFGSVVPSGVSDSANANNVWSEASKRGTSYLRSRMPLLPLLDLHKEHDIDSLPSPTRESTPCLPVVVKVGIHVGKEGQAFGDAKVHPYESEAIKAVSSYQHKFGRNPLFRTDDLPSPTPSEDSSNGNGDIGGEVSSSFVTSSKPGRPVISGNNVPLPSNSNARNLPGTKITSDLTVRPSAKSRDPRLRFARPDGAAALPTNQNSSNDVGNVYKVEPSGSFISSRKVKAADEPLVDGPAWKKQKNGLENHENVTDVPSDPKAKSNAMTMENRATIMTRNFMPCNGVSSSLPSLLKEIADNPAALLKLLKMGERQRLIDSPPKKPTDPRRAAQLPGSSVQPVSVPLANLSKPGGVNQDSSQAIPLNESGKIRMKPRDPRRILHGDTLQTTGNLLEKHLKASENPTSGTKPAITQLDQQQHFSDLVNGKVPDISTQFTKNPKNISDMAAVSQASSPPATPQIPPAQFKTDKDTNVKQTDKDTNVKQTSVSASVMAATGPVRSVNSWGDVEHLFEGYDDKQKAAIQRERARRLEEQKKMFSSRKLCLVLDLDHTLLNSAKFNEVDPIHDEILRKKEEQDRGKPYRHLFRFPHMGMWTKLRPGVWNFLEKASKLYELHLSTMGNKLYATKMAKVLDPKGVLFNGRVISRGDDGEPFDGDERVPKSKDLEGVLGMESAVVIIDDSVKVWPHNKMNLIAVERYTYFPCSRRQFGLPGPSLLEIDHDERPEDGTLASSLAVIERIHQNFFSHASLDEADVRNILASEQRKILSGCRIVFSRVFPVGEASPHLHPLWQTAEQFGAVCTTQIDDNVTHVVANSLGTDKVNWALSKGRFVVHPGWVEASALLYRRANEHDFAIKP